MQILGDFTTTVEKALSEINPKWRDLDGLVVAGTHSPHNIEEMLTAIERCRTAQYPFLGICFGHQLAAVEYARNVLHMEKADSEEWGSPDGQHVVVKLPELKVGLHDGESYWNNYEVLPNFIKLWKKNDNFITCQYHPEYQSSKDKPHPLLVQFLTLCGNVE